MSQMRIAVVAVRLPPTGIMGRQSLVDLLAAAQQVLAPHPTPIRLAVVLTLVSSPMDRLVAPPTSQEHQARLVLVALNQAAKPN